MRKNILVLLCVAFIIQFTGLLPLQAGHYYYKQISLKDGLPSTVRCILTDEQGFVCTLLLAFNRTRVLIIKEQVHE